MASLMPQGKQQYFDSNGNPLSGGKLYAFAAGTSTPLDTYSDQAGTIPNTNPVVMNARGEATIFWGSSAYKVTLKDASDVEIWTQDNLQALVGVADLASTAAGKGAALVGFDGGTLADFFKTKNNRVVDSITALRALDKTKFTRAFVTGYYAAGDGGGGPYWYDSTDTTSADNGGTIIVATDGGRWKLQLILGDHVSIKQFGAKVDGATDDTTKINAALATGRNVYANKGTSVITAALTISASQQLFGDGPDISIIQVNGNGYDALTLSASYAGLRDLSFTATAVRTGSAYIKFSAATRNNSVRRVKLNNAFYGIHIAADAVITYLADIEIQNTAQTSGISIFIAGGNDTFLKNIVMDAPSGAQPLCGVRIKRNQAVWMDGCDMIHQGRGIQIDPDGAAGDLITWCFFTDCACDLGSGDGIYIAPTNAATIKGLFFDNCWSSSNQNGVNIVGSGGSIDGVYLTDCTAFNNKLRGIWNQAAANVEIQSCRVAGNSGAASGTYAGIEIANSTSNFKISNTHSGAQAGFGASQSYGLLIGTGCNNYSVTDNIFLSNVTATMGDSSMSTSTQREVRGNLGFKTIASGSAIILTGTNQIAVPHGLGGTPTIALATPTNTNLGGLDHWTGSFGASAFNINTSGNVGSNATFSWTASLYN